MSRFLILSGSVILIVFLAWGCWHAVVEAPHFSFHASEGPQTGRWLTVLLIGIIAVPLAGILIAAGLSEQKREQSFGADRPKAGRWQRPRKGGWHSIVEGGGLIILCCIVIAIARAWWNSIPPEYSDPGMGVVAAFLGRAVLALPIGFLLLIGACGIFTGAIRLVYGIGTVVAGAAQRHRRSE